MVLFLLFLHPSGRNNIANFSALWAILNKTHMDAASDPRQHKQPAQERKLHARSEQASTTRENACMEHVTWDAVRALKWTQ